MKMCLMEVIIFFQVLNYWFTRGWDSFKMQMGVLMRTPPFDNEAEYFNVNILYLSIANFHKFVLIFLMCSHYASSFFLKEAEGRVPKKRASVCWFIIPIFLLLLLIFSVILDLFHVFALLFSCQDILLHAFKYSNK